MLDVGLERNVAASEVGRILVEVLSVEAAAVVGRPDGSVTTQVVDVVDLFEGKGIRMAAISICREQSRTLGSRGIHVLDVLPEVTLGKKRKVIFGTAATQAA